MLSLTDICKSYDTSDGPITVLDRITLSLAAGQTLALTGESGSGKSTLLHICAGLDAPDRGRIEIAGLPMGGTDAERAALRRGTVGLVFQQFNLIPSLNVAANLAFQARLSGRHDQRWQKELASALGLETLLARYPEELSGGQQQRVAIGRTLAARPSLVLADEPTGNLDERSSDRVMELMLRLVAETGAALLMVTHSPRLAGMLDRRLHLSGGRLT